MVASDRRMVPSSGAELVKSPGWVNFPFGQGTLSLLGRDGIVLSLGSGRGSGIASNLFPQGVVNH